MADIIEPRLLKGFRDYGPEEQAARQDMFAKIQGVFERFGFLPMSTPVLEYKDILVGKIGEEEKLIYSFKDNGDRDVAMRYDLTVSLARYVAQNRGQITLPFKRYQIAPVWRADNPQKGRLREFYQCDIDAVGGPSPVSDAEVIVCMCKAIEAVGITNYQLRLNDRSIFDLLSSLFLEAGAQEGEAQEVMRAIDKVNKVGKIGAIKILEEKNVSQAAIKQAQMLMDLGEGEQALANIEQNLSKDSWAVVNLRTLLALVKAQGIADKNILFDPLIMRGLDYYTGAVFEMMLLDKPEFGSIGGGGRYDNLVDKFADQSIPAVGTSIGIDRLFDALTDQGLIKPSGIIKALVVNLDEQLMEDYVRLVTSLRDAGINSEMYYQPVKLDKQFKYAESKGIEYAVIMGSEEKAKGIMQLKNLKTREQTEVPLEDLVKKLK
jgi:histidyl-tRNA synthetase